MYGVMSEDMICAESAIYMSWMNEPFCRAKRKVNMVGNWNSISLVVLRRFELFLFDCGGKKHRGNDYMVIWFISYMDYYWVLFKVTISNVE